MDLTRFAWLSIAAAVATIALKTFAWRITGSVGLLSDAAESVVNLVAAVVALIALRVAIKPPDKDHNFGHSKAEYFSAAVEGAMIFVAAGVIMVSAVQRFLHPQPLENVGVGLLVSVVASVLNGSVAWVLLRAGKQYRSMTLTADGKHLMTDVWTSAGVVAGVGLVWLTDWPRLDSIVAFAVGVNILFTGGKLMHESGMGLMDVSLPKEDNRRIREILESFTGENIMFHGVRTRESGHRRFMDMHLLVPGAWSVQQAHDLVEDITDALLEAYPDLHVMIHSEPIDDPRSYDDYDFGIS
ncbi:Cobalt-zinc-cadmium resistance protein [Luteococcus japonicus LSP_Lj1]|uniref:Cobalt-zinc-cadmium resistance protein n=1 Tax=Luteococcus japonicus LSP_Lj1 TaxID=1255658 RepID=A0A1R4KES9_9ACTN|nr:Cobalt-zinc-cadmium resistance protein [Luteococcus japonicus LSP_Lj1]